MKVFIRKVDGRKYRTAEGGWMPQPGEARNFGASRSAFDHCRQFQLEGVEILFDFDDPDFNFTVHVPSLISNLSKRTPQINEAVRVGVPKQVET